MTRYIYIDKTIYRVLSINTLINRCKNVKIFDFSNKLTEKH